MYYYDVAVGVEKHWKSGVFTYSYGGELGVGSLVQVPFGKKSKAGVVMTQVEKPKFKFKELVPYHNIKVSQQTLDFADWYAKYYAAKPGQVYTQFLPHYLTKKLPEPTAILSSKTPNPILNKQQQRAKKELQNSAKPAVLHGVTGAGKTRLYLAMIIDTLAEGHNALLLYPEIALTTQLLEELRHYVPVVEFHSGLTNAERSKRWFAVATAKEPLVVMGPRSALFLPHKHLGLIVIDEAHESTFKQDSDVRYNGILAAGGLAKAHGAKLIIGSATPPITETELILGSGGSLVCLHEHAITHDHNKTIHVVDRKDRKLFRKNQLLSDQLITALQMSLDGNKQSLLFINRRGTAKLTLCENCGWQAECPDCELPTTYHHDTHKMICHTCGKMTVVEPLCPDCTHKTTLKALGSKAVVEEVQRLFPGARIGRFDSDNAKEASFSERYEAIKAGEVDILIGTQQIVKGLDLPLLNTVGVLDADLSLHFPDYSSDERTFQLLAQVAGRVGRGHGAGVVYVQTLHPKSETISLATTEDWHGFRDSELIVRKNHRMPPYTFGAKIIFRDKKLDNAFDRAKKQKDKITAAGLPVEVLGPLPSFVAKKGGSYYVQIHIKSTSRAKLLQSISLLSQDEIYDLDPTTFL